MTILLAWLLADFISGVAHWFEDHVLDERFAFAPLKGIHVDNQLHHRKPAEMLKNSLWGNINTSAPYAWAAAIALFFAGAPTIIWLSVFFVSFVNLTHRWAHMPPAKLNPAVKFMQWTGLFIDMRQHNKHHIVGRKLAEKENSRRCYCAMTSLLNPVLDRIGFWRMLAVIFRRG
jgi:hypothetical protein